jgi:hypothetical protein
LNEQDKADAIKALDEKADKEKRKIARKAAILAKVQGIFNVTISAAEAVMSAWAAAMKLGPIAGPIMGGIMTGVIGAIQTAETAVVASRPIPEAAEGAYLPGSADGTILRAGERNKPEIILPLESGVDKLLTRMFERTREMGNQAASAARSFSFGSEGRPVNVTLQVGTLIADPASMKTLERKLSEFRILESTRLGAAY